MLGNLVRKTLKFAFGQGFVAEEAAKAFIAKAETLTGISSVQMLEQLYEMLAELMALAFNDIRPVHQFPRMVRHIRHVLLTAARKAARQPRAAQARSGDRHRIAGLWLALFELLRCIRVFDHELSGRPEALQVLANHVIDCLCVLSFKSDLIVCLHAFASIGEKAGRKLAMKSRRR
jgi:hypothetical protein